MRRVRLFLVGLIAWPLMFVGICGMALWMSAGGDARPIDLSKDGQS